MSNLRRIMVTGCRGRLGTELVGLFAGNYEVVGVGRDEGDITDHGAIEALIESVRPEIVLHTAAMTNVDRCEVERDLAFEVNVEGARNVAQACSQIGCRMVFCSTDYVFSGEKGSPYVENDVANPINYYGQTKLAGEQAVVSEIADPIILRVARLYGRYGNDFVKSIIRAGEKQISGRKSGGSADPIRVVEGQIGNPTSTAEVALQTEKLIESNEAGLFHCVSEGAVSRMDMVRAIFEILNWDVEFQLIKPPATEAPRPENSALTNQRLSESGLNLMRPWRVVLKEFLDRYGKEIACAH